MRLVWVDEVGDAYAEHVEHEHRGGEEAHAEGIRSGADDAGDDEDDEDGVANCACKQWNLCRRLRCRRRVEEEDEDRPSSKQMPRPRMTAKKKWV